LIYGIFSVAWILITDQINLVISPDVRYATLIAIIKGLFFVITSTFLIYILLKIDEKQRDSLRNELHAMQDSFTRMFANNPLPMWVNSQEDFRFLAVNDATSKLFGYSRENFLEMNLAAICSENDRDPILRIASKQFEGIYTTGPWIQIDSTGLPIQVNLALVRFEFAGRPALLVTCVDLSKQKEIEESLKRTANERDAFESFGYSISHDLKANLRAVSGYSQLLLEDFGKSLDPQARDYLAKMQMASDRMTKTINNLLMLSQLTRASLTVSWVDLSVITQSICDEFSQQEPERQVKIELQQKVFALADSELIKTALQKLLENSWMYTSKTKDAYVKFGVMDDKVKGKVYFIQDNRVGFDAKKATELFKPFQRFSPQAEFPGSGIGLSIVARIIELHHGTIWAESQPDKGATFYFTLGLEDPLHDL
jgi:PAS domain S-box-containing protein